MTFKVVEPQPKVKLLIQAYEGNFAPFYHEVLWPPLFRGVSSKVPEFELDGSGREVRHYISEAADMFAEKVAEKVRKMDLEALLKLEGSNPVSKFKSASLAPLNEKLLGAVFSEKIGEGRPYRLEVARRNGVPIDLTFDGLKKFPVYGKGETVDVVRIQFYYERPADSILDLRQMNQKVLLGIEKQLLSEHEGKWIGLSYGQLICSDENKEKVEEVLDKLNLYDCEKLVFQVTEEEFNRLKRPEAVPPPDETGLNVFSSKNLTLK